MCSKSQSAQKSPLYSKLINNVFIRNYVIMFIHNFKMTFFVTKGAELRERTVRSYSKSSVHKQPPHACGRSLDELNNSAVKAVRTLTDSKENSELE